MENLYNKINLLYLYNKCKCSNKIINIIIINNSKQIYNNNKPKFNKRCLIFQTTSKLINKKI